MTEGFFKWLARNIRESSKEINALKHDLAARGTFEIILSSVFFIVIIMITPLWLMDPILRLAFYLSVGVGWVLLLLHGWYMITRGWS
jgi:hypothetical protein